MAYSWWFPVTPRTLTPFLEFLEGFIIIGRGRRTSGSKISGMRSERIVHVSKNRAFGVAQDFVYE